MATQAGELAKEPLRKASPWIRRLARAGYAAKGIVYIVIGWLAARAAIGAGGKTTDTNGAVQSIGQKPLGDAALLIIGIGLLGYTLWRIVSAVTDAERRGDDPSSIAVRLGHAARGIAYGALGIRALREGLSHPTQQGSGAQAQHWTARLLDMPFGKLLVMAAGLGIIGYAGYQMYRAFSDKVKKNLDLAEAGPAQAKWIVRIGRFGIGARAVVFTMIGVFLLRAASRHDAGEAGGVAQSLDALSAAPYGRVVLGVVALGVAAYGAYQIATARYRFIRAVG
ncbi:MAG: DUF1206 domain-containing protein [Gemmatimonadaceae bacterium]